MASIKQVYLADLDHANLQLLAQASKAGVTLVWYQLGQRHIAKEHVDPALPCYMRQRSVTSPGSVHWYKNYCVDIIDGYDTVAEHEVNKSILLTLALIEG